jgi:hypothetical protein
LYKCEGNTSLRTGACGSDFKLTLRVLAKGINKFAEVAVSRYALMDDIQYGKIISSSSFRPSDLFSDVLCTLSDRRRVLLR